MKQKLLTLLIALISLQAVAQEDVTSWLTNPDFEDRTNGWQTSGMGGQTNSDFPLKHGNVYAETWTGDGGTVTDVYIRQQLSGLPAGRYTLTVTCQNLQSGKPSTGAYIFLNNEKTEFGAADDYKVSCLVTDGELLVGAMTKNCKGNYVCVDNFRLAYSADINELRESVRQLIEESEALDHHTGTEVQKELDAAREALRTYLDGDSSEGLSEAMNRLRKAMLNYRFSIATETDPYDITELVANAGFEKGSKDWTFESMGTQSNDSFKKKVGSTYAEKWTGSAGVGNGKIYQTITDLPSGKYRLTAVAHNIIEWETATTCTGAWIFGEDQRTAVSKDARYSVDFTVVGGSATIGFVAENASGNWICVDDFHLLYLGMSGDMEKDALNALISQAESLKSQDMDTNIMEELNAALSQARSAEGSQSINEAAKRLKAAIAAAEANIPLYKTLESAITNATKALSDGTNGKEVLEKAIADAEQVYLSGTLTQAIVDAQCLALSNAVFAFHIANASGEAPQVETFPVVIEGSTAACGRLTVKGDRKNVLETGFCYSTDPEPTVLDGRNTKTLSSGGNNIYVMENLTPATVYYVRAYVMTNTYAVGYGEVKRIITKPEGRTEYTYLFNADEERNKAIDNAMREATLALNTWSCIRGFHPTANYSPGTETADCSYGGWINVGPWRGDTSTMLHEIGHGIGVGQHWRWWDGNLHWGDSGIWWLGERANRITEFFEPGLVCNGDNIHVCYQNGGNDIERIRTASLYQALYEDGLPAVSDGACPFYSFESLDTLKYFISNEKFGMNSKFLCESATGKLNYVEVADVNELSDDRFAWNLIFQPETGMYHIRNVKSGKYFSYSTASFGLKNTKSPSNAENIHLMPCRYNDEFKVGTKDFSIKPYWFAYGNRDITPPVMNMATAKGSTVSSVELDFANSSESQHWIILSAEQVKEIAKVKMALDTERLERYIAGSKVLLDTEHKELTVDADASFRTQVDEIELRKENAVTELELSSASSDMLEGLMTYLANIQAIDVHNPLDLSFIIDDPDLSTGSNWNGIGTIKDSKIEYTTETFSFSQKLPVRLAKGTWGIFVRAFQRPGTAMIAANNYKKGINDVSTYFIVNKNEQLIKHVVQGQVSEKFNQGGVERKINGYYQPNDITAAIPYLDNGLYDNVISINLRAKAEVTIGMRNEKEIENNWVVIDGFRLCYYGTDIQKEDVTPIMDITSDNSDADAYYTLDGIRHDKAQKGINIIRTPEGTTKKVLIK